MPALQTRYYHLFFTFVLLQALSFVRVSAQTDSPSPDTCLSGGFYECSIDCDCNLTNPDNILNLVLSIISITFSLFMIASYIMVKELRQKPGDIIFALAISDIIWAVGRILATLSHLQNNFFSSDDTTACQVSSGFNIAAIGLTYCYHLSFFIYYLSILKTSLKGAKIPGFLYHLLPLIGATLYTTLLSEQGYLGRSLFGVCEMKTTPGIVLPIVTNVVLLIIIYIFAHYTRRYIPESEKISSLKTQFVRFYLKYLIAISIIYIAKGIMDTLTGIMLNDLLEDDVTQDLIDNLNVVKILNDILNGLTPIVLTLGRLNDPMIQHYWRKLLYREAPRDLSDPSNSLTETFKQRGSLNVREFQINLEMQSHVQQFQHSRRVEVLYSLLSGIHYFWNVKQMNKLIELAPLRFSSEEDEVSEDYIKESKNIRTLFVQEDTLTRQVPELFEEIKDKHYNLARGTLTAYAPRLFEEIIELDSVGRGIRQSLDLKRNFTRILKSGVNGGGKSGEFFFFSADNKFIIKTVSDAEVEVFREILPAYTRHLKLNPNSVIAKIYGAFKFEIAEPYERYNLILMKNINGYPSDCVDRKYDLKGSTVGRITVKEVKIDITQLKHRGVLKDLDFDKFEKKINATQELKESLLSAIQNDIKFLSSMKLVDYSLALYVIDRKKYASTTSTESPEPSPDTKETEELKDPSSGETDISSNKSLVEADDGSPESVVQFKSITEDKYYHIGIIDYLIQFGLKKRSEVFFKKLGALDPNLDISVQQPSYYGERFVKYMEKIIKD